MKPEQKVCLYEISEEFESGSCRLKNKVTRSYPRKTCVRSRGHIFSPIIMKLHQHVCHDEISHTNLKMGHVGSKTRSPGQILEKPCVHSLGYIFCLIIMKLGQNDFLDQISDKYENGSCRVKN